MSDLNGAAPVNCDAPIHPKAIEGLELFNRGQYFEAHEALEAAWRAEPGPVRELYRGILQAGVVYLHITRRNYAGAVKVHQRCQKWLRPWPETCRGIEVGQLRQDLEAVMTTLQKLGPHKIAEFDPAMLKSIRYRNEPGG
jgi:uncharacterized protein